MRNLLACLLLSACASVPARAPAERLAGCWAASDDPSVTMRWQTDAARPGFASGIKVDGEPARLTHYSLAPSGDEYALCELGDGAAPDQCWTVAQGQGGSLEGGRAFVDAHGSRLRIVVLGAGPERTIFLGERRACE